VQKQKNVKEYHRKARQIRWLTLSLEAPISVSGSLGPFASQYTGKMWEYWLKYETGSFWNCDEKSFLRHDVPRHQHKRHKLVTDMHQKSYSSPESQCRSSWQKVALFLSFTNLFFTCGLMYADTTKCEHFLIKKGILDWKHVLERLRSHEHSMEHVDATITFSRRCHCEELMQN